MKKILINIIFLGLIVFQTSASEEDILLKTFSYHFRNISVDSALNRIEVDMDYFFIYNSKLTNNKGKINAYFEDYPLTVILDSLFNDPVLAYKIIDKQIVIYPKLEKENEIPSTDTTPKLQDY